MPGHQFIIQLIISFVAGGSIIAILTLIAERVNDRLAGIVLAFPSTAALSYFFLGWTTSANEVSSVIPATFIPLGLTVFFPVIYLYSAKYLEKEILGKTFKIVISFAISTVFWLVLSIIVASYQISGFLIGLIVYTSLIILTHYLLHKFKTKRPQHPKYSYMQKTGRTIFVGLIIVLVVVLGKKLGPFWGGVFAMYPAAFSSSVVIFHKYYKPDQIFPLVSNIGIGSLSIVAYSLTVWWTFPNLGFIWGSLIACFVSLITSAMLSFIGFRIKTTAHTVKS